jgi:hypothetical protein
MEADLTNPDLRPLIMNQRFETRDRRARNMAKWQDGVEIGLSPS